MVSPSLTRLLHRWTDNLSPKLPQNTSVGNSCTLHYFAKIGNAITTFSVAMISDIHIISHYSLIVFQ